MVMIVQGDNNLFKGLVYGVDRNPGTMAYLQQQAQHFSGALTDFGQQFAQGVQALHDSFNSSEAMRIARAALRRFDAMFLPDKIMYLESLGNLQNAPIAMQRWIMAHDGTRKMYHEQRLDGYSATYQDMWPSQRNLDHVDWRMIHNGIMMETEDGHVMTHWLDDVQEGDVTLRFDQQCDILDTHAVQDAYIELGQDDFTDRSGGKL
jgi:hypothetical protein